MRRDDALRILGQHAERLRSEHAVKSLSIFGSVARDDARADSDVDILVEFSKPVGLFAFGRLHDELTQLLDCGVDLATPRALHRQLRERILREAIRAA